MRTMGPVTLRETHSANTRANTSKMAEMQTNSARSASTVEPTGVIWLVSTTSRSPC